MKDKIVIATIKEWNYKNLIKFRDKYGSVYDIYFCKTKDELTYKFLNSIKPKYVFFPHWSYIIPSTIYEKFDCIVFHMTDLPYGRGGSPLQNLILAHKEKTKISAIKVEKGLDTGDIYLKKDLYIGDGTASQIYKKASDMIFFKMIPEILSKSFLPKKQTGKVHIFKRRTPSESDVLRADFKTLKDFYDFIRMLDAEDYPKAFIKYKNFSIFFSKTKFRKDKLEGRFEIIYEK